MPAVTFDAELIKNVLMKKSILFPINSVLKFKCIDTDEVTKSFLPQK